MEWDGTEDKKEKGMRERRMGVKGGEKKMKK
jgi:hypothetical protein